MHCTKDFWQGIEQLIASTKIFIDRPRDSVHPRFEDFVFSVDYGYLKGTASMDGGGSTEQKPLLVWGSLCETPGQYPLYVKIVL